ncbi:hypothetical protein Tco_0825375 [Tanacetum coccineum]
MKVFNNMKRPTKAFSGHEVALFPTMIDVTEPSTSPSRITSSPSPLPKPSPSHSPKHSPEPSPLPTPEHITAAPSQPLPTHPSPTQPSLGAEHHLPTPNESPIYVVYLHRSDEGRLKLNELTDLVTKLFDRIRALEDDLKKTKQTYNVIYRSDSRYKAVKKNTAGGTVTYTRRSVDEKVQFFEKVGILNQQLVPMDMGMKLKVKTLKRKRQKLEEDAEKEELKVFLDIIPREKLYGVESLLQSFRLIVEELYRLVRKGIVPSEVRPNMLIMREYSKSSDNLKILKKELEVDHGVHRHLSLRTITSLGEDVRNNSSQDLILPRVNTAVWSKLLTWRLSNAGDYYGSNSFNQMEAIIQQSPVDKQCLEIAKKELLLENDRLLQQIMSQDVLLTMMNSMSLNDDL